MAQTKHTLREILSRLEVISRERPEDQSVIIDVANIINRHVQLIDQLKKLKPEESGFRDIATVNQVLYD